MKRNEARRQKSEARSQKMGMISGFLGMAMLVVSVVVPAATTAQERSAQLSVRSIDGSRYPSVEMLVNVRDSAGVGISNLTAADFQIEEGGRVLPGEFVQVEPFTETRPAFDVAIVLDLSTLLRDEAMAQIRSDARAMVGQLFANADGAVEVGMFVPRGSDANQALIAIPFSHEQAELEQALDNMQPRTGRTDVYNTVAAAISATADRAAQRNVPAHVIVLTDGLDRTSIVGSGTSGANEVARLAEERRVTVSAFGYGGGLRSGSTALTQVADRTGGLYLPNPQQADLARLVETFRTQASGGLYRLRYRTSLPADGREQPVSLRIATASLELHTETTLLLPKPWEPQVTRQLELQADAQQYPHITADVRPINNLRRTVPNLGASDFAATLGETELGAPASVTAEPLDPSDPAAAQSVALVVDQNGPHARTLREMAIAFLQTPNAVPSRVALFVPGFGMEQNPFTHDHNAVINALNQAAISRLAGDPGATLLSAIDAAAQDGNGAKRPAYAVWLADTPLDPSVRAQVLTQARNQGVTIHVITADTSADLSQFAEATEGTHLAAPDSAALTTLANQIAADHAVRYRLSFRSPLLADGEERTLTVTTGQQRASANVRLFVGGQAQLGVPLAPAAQFGLALVVGLGLLAAVVVPRVRYNRKLRCPQCGHVKRSSWGASCLFCEYEAASNVGTSAPLEVPLVGFAQQGAALVEDLRATPHSPASQPISAPLPQAEATPLPMVYAGATSNVVEEHSQTGFEQAQSQRHTDFWGALPGEHAIAHDSNEADYADARPAPPDLPVFVADTREPEQSTGTSQPLQNREESHTDFWGPAVAGAEFTIERTEVPAHKEVSAGVEPKEVNRFDCAVEAPVITSFASDDETPAHTDFWGAASDGAEPRPAPKPLQPDQPDPAANTDFWGPVKR